MDLEEFVTPFPCWLDVHAAPYAKRLVERFRRQLRSAHGAATVTPPNTKKPI
jgi:hypothetical protein